MSEETALRVPQCTLDYAFQHLGGKYKGRLLWNLRLGPLRYGQLRRQLRGVSTKMLAQALQELEADELIARQLFQEAPLRVEYSLLPSARPLLPFLFLLHEWAGQQMTKAGIPRHELDAPV